MKIIITSKNRDKITITKRLLSTISPSLEIYSLVDFNITDEYEEHGSIMDRASGKVRFYKEILDDTNQEYDAVVGIDDGLAIPEFNEDTPFSKKLAEKILNGDYPLRTRVINKRAYSLILPSGEERNTTTETPFEFIGNSKDIKREDEHYPLSYVLSPIGNDETLADMDTDEQYDYYLKYARDPISELLA